MTETKTRLTADQLGIPQIEYDALIWVRDALDPTISDHDLPEWMRFDMRHWGHVPDHVVEKDHGDYVTLPLAPMVETNPKYGCGTACCIGGSMQMHIAGLTKYRIGEIIPVAASSKFSEIKLVSAEDVLKDLFFCFPNDATREEAVQAIDNVLIHGQTIDPWNKLKD